MPGQPHLLLLRQCREPSHAFEHAPPCSLHHRLTAHAEQLSKLGLRQAEAGTEPLEAL